MIPDKKQMYNRPKNYVKQISVLYTPCIMCAKYIGGMFSTSEGYHKYIRRGGGGGGLGTLFLHMS